MNRPVKDTLTERVLRFEERRMDFSPLEKKRHAERVFCDSNKVGFEYYFCFFLFIYFSLHKINYFLFIYLFAVKLDFAGTTRPLSTSS
jgi:hypothetical protein